MSGTRENDARGTCRVEHYANANANASASEGVPVSTSPRPVLDDDASRSFAPSSSLASNSSTPSERRRLERLSSYRLYAVVVHSGVLEGGHYVAYVKRRGRWFLCDDASVEPVSETRVLAAQAFMLFYESETSSGKE